MEKKLQFNKVERLGLNKNCYSLKRAHPDKHKKPYAVVTFYDKESFESFENDYIFLECELKELSESVQTYVKWLEQEFDYYRREREIVIDLKKKIRLLESLLNEN